MQKAYVPAAKEAACRTRTYGHLETMRQLKDNAMPHFQTGPDGPRSWKQYVDDSERILNGYTMSREAQGKEGWQSNLLDNISRAKLTAIAAGVGLKVPEMEVTAKNRKGMRSAARAEIMKNTVRQSYSDTNSTLQSFLETWTLLSHGVVFEYEGYKTGGAFQNVIDSFDSVTGAIKTHREYRRMDGKPFNVILNPQEFYWWTFFKRDVQEQARVAWVQTYSKAELELEFSKFPNYKYVKDKAEAGRMQPMQDTLYYEKWKEHVGASNEYEVIRMYSKEDDASAEYYGYEIWVNGVPLLLAPLLWGDKEKKYPFTKEISAPFANTNFFVGMSLPAILEAYQDGKNTILNSLIDKLYRGLDPMKLVGLQNRDLFDVESSVVTQDSTIYVPDINAVKFLEHPQINQGELAMLTILDRGIESSSVDRSQQGVAGATQKTARQAVIEDTRAREIKGVLYLFLENLWLQKTKLRIHVILSHYLKDKAAQKDVAGKIISIKDYSFGDGTRGQLDIYVAKSKSDRMSEKEIEAREMAMEEQGIAYKIVSMDVDYLNDWEYEITVLPQSFHKQDKVAKEEELMGEIQQVTTLFPEFFVANKDHYLQEVLELHGKSLEDYNPPAQVPMTPENPEEALPEELPAEVTPLA